MQGILRPPAVLYLRISATKYLRFYIFFYPFSFSPKGKGFDSFPPGGRPGRGLKRYCYKKVYLKTAF
jgi:hypothetical protein